MLTEGEVLAEHRTVVYQYDDGLLDYVKHLNSSKKVDVVHEDVIAFETEDTERHIAVEMAMQWTTAYSESVHTTPTPSTPTRAVPTKRGSVPR